jgi:hypothetical protein
MDSTDKRDQAKTILVKKIPSAIQHLKRTITLVALYWFLESDLTDVEPLAGFRYESERQKMVAANDIETYWYPPDSWHMELDEGEQAVIRSFLQEAAKKEDWYAFRNLLQDVAFELTQTKSQWSNGKFNITDDFVVYVLEGRNLSDGLGAALAASVDDTQIKSWKSQGYLNDSIL